MVEFLRFPVFQNIPLPWIYLLKPSNHRSDKRHQHRGSVHAYQDCILAFLIHKRGLIVLGCQHSVVETDILTLVFVDASVAEAGILIPLEFVDCIIHQSAVEYSKTDEQLEVLHVQSSDLLEQSRLKLCNDVLQTPLSKVRQIHEDG